MDWITNEVTQAHTWSVKENTVPQAYKVEAYNLDLTKQSGLLNTLTPTKCTSRKTSPEHGCS